MTRINVIPVRELSDKHLVAEYRELPRLYKLSKAWADAGAHKPIPAEYTLGKGHVTFFYDKLVYIWRRHWQLCHEMNDRGFTVNFYPPSLMVVHLSMVNDYKPTRKALSINRARIAKRLAGDKT